MAKAQSQPRASTGKPPRRKSQPAAPVQQTKKQIAHGKRVARQQRIILIAAAAFGAVILGIAVAALINQLWLQPNRPVAVVNGKRVSAREHQALVSFERYGLESTIAQYQNQLDSLNPEDENNSLLIQIYQQQITQLQSQLAELESSALEELIDDVLIAEKAQEAGIIVLPTEVQQALDDFKSPPTPTPQATVTDTVAAPTATPIPAAQIDSLYKSWLQSVGISDGDLRSIFQRNLLSEKVQELLATQVVTTGLVVEVELIQTDAEDQIATAQTRIESGEEWATVAKELSTDTQTKDKGGKLGPVTVGQVSLAYGDELESVVFSLQPGEMKRATSNSKFYLVRLVSRQENGALPEDEVKRRQANALSDWLAQRRASPDVTIQRYLVTPTSSPEALPTQATP